MDVSIIVPTRNRSELLALALRSALRQQELDIEVVVVDEASTDETPCLLAAIKDARLRVVRHDVPRGVGSARNHGAALSRGEWLAFLDDDDVWAPDKLVRQVRAAEGVNSDWAYGGAVTISAGGQIVWGCPPPTPEQVVSALPRYNAIPGGGSNVIVRRKAWTKAGPFETRLRNTEDWEMWIRLAKHGPPACVSDPLVGYRVHERNASLDVAEILRGTRLIETLHHTKADWGRLHRWIAESYLRMGQHRHAAEHYASAAFRGEAFNVLSDISALAGRRLRRFCARQEAGRPPGAWTRTAANWLRELECSAAVTGADGHAFESAPTVNSSGR